MGLAAGFIKHLDYNNLLAGMLAGVTATVILHPLELIKVRMQVDEASTKSAEAGATGSKPRYSGVFQALKSIYREGGFRALYQGVTPNMWGSGASWGCYFLVYNSLKSLHVQYLYGTDDGSLRRLPAHVHVISSFLAGALTAALTNPIWMMKTRLCLQYKTDKQLKSSHPSGKVPSPSVPHYSGMIDGLYKVVRDEGFFALYKGMSFGILGTLHGVVQFTIYEQLKQAHLLNLPGATQLPTYYYALYSGISKVAAVLSTYPFQLIRSRLQNQHARYTNGYEVIVAVIRNEGWTAFYKGIIPNLLRVTPASCITFVVYETVKSLLSRIESGNHPVNA